MEAIGLNLCEFDKTRKSLSIASKCFAGSFPREFNVKSHHTGKTIKFVPVVIGHPFYDEDGWDGEQQIYVPMTDLPNVEYMIIYHQW